MIKEPYECFKIVEAVKHHMAGNVSIQKYGWSSKVNSLARYEALKGEKFLYKKILEKLQGDEADIKSYAAAAYLRDPGCWVGSLGDFEKEYLELKAWNKWPVQKSILEMKELLSTKKLDGLTGIIGASKETSYVVANVMMRYEMSPELFVHLDRCFSIGKYCKAALKGNVIWDLIGPRLTRYSMFVMVPSTDEIEEIRKEIISMQNLNLS